MTNGGGTSESERARRLTASLGIRIEGEQIVQAHTVLKTVAVNYQNDAVLILGGDGMIERVGER